MNITDMKLSDDAIQVLACLPKEPLAWAIPDLAEELFGQTDTVALSRVKAALQKIERLLFTEYRNTRPYGHKHIYGIRADRWEEAKAFFK